MTTQTARRPSPHTRTQERAEPERREERKSSGTALARVPDGVLGTFRKADQIEASLRAAHERCILVSPTTTAAALPEGVAVALSAILVDVQQETYRVAGGDDDDRGGGKVGLSGPVLYRVAAAAGVSWDPQLSGRLDDGSDPYYCRWRAVGRVRLFDGSIETFTGEKEVDMREGSPQVELLVAQSANKIRREAKKRNEKLSEATVQQRAKERAQGQVRQVRLHLQSHAETKAQLRAIRRRFGLRTSYSPAELEAKPIVAVRAVFTGESSDPEIRRENAAAIRQSFLGASAAMYGPPALPPPAATAQRPMPPPPVGRGLDPNEDSGEYDLDVDPETGEVHQRGAASGAPAAREDQGGAPDEPASEDEERETDEPTFRFGRLVDQPLSEGSMRDLEWYAEALRRSIEDPDKSRWKADNERELETVEAEISRRESDTYGDER